MVLTNEASASRPWSFHCSLNSTSSLSLSVAPKKVYSSFHQRLLIWTSAWQMGLENPLLGNGWGQFELFYPFYQGRLMIAFPPVRELRTHANNAHNEILDQWSQAGLLGLGAYLWFFFHPGRRFLLLLQTLKRRGRGFSRTVCCGSGRYVCRQYVQRFSAFCGAGALILVAYRRFGFEDFSSGRFRSVRRASAVTA